MGRYIIKNCEQIHSADNFCWSKNVLCQDCTDCVMKQIVELCEYYKKYIDCKADCPSFRMFLSKLLSKLDIQEVE